MPPARTTTRRKAPAKTLNLSYADSGVNLEDKDSFTEGLASVVRRTFGPRVIDNPGGFAGLFRLDYNERLFARNYKHPVLVACADGVGTKLKLAAEMKKFDTIGIDLVAMNVNDMIVQGAEPLFFLDYIATPKVDKAMLNALVAGIVDGCVQSGCALLGGETAEMPDVYAPGDFDLAGFAVGVVDLDRAIDGGRVCGTGRRGGEGGQEQEQGLGQDRHQDARRGAADANADLCQAGAVGAQELQGQEGDRGDGAHHRLGDGREPLSGAARRRGRGDRYGQLARAGVV